LASNCDQKENLAEARQRLSKFLFDMDYTQELWTEPYTTNIPQKNCALYLNQLVYAQTSLSVEELQARLKQLELEMGRTQKDRQQGIVRIDLDLMRYDDCRYHEKDWERPYIKMLLR
jgi:2-amino-4-hydroxy-6-hydroxymethyldihydropteridine diphosphokinase